MKILKNILQMIAITVVVSLLSFYSYPKSISGDSSDQDTLLKYANGIYEGVSQHIYRDEPFWGKVKVMIEGGKMSIIRFSIRDSALHETFDQNYEKHFVTIPEYVQQCRNDWKGVQAYPAMLQEKQDIRKVDAISGATWSYNIFRAAVDSALKKAVIN
jgi:major membrane immunogen (membrane-anchored lipoprotein)